MSVTKKKKEVCHGRRFNQSFLAISLRNKIIYDSQNCWRNCSNFGLMFGCKNNSNCSYIKGLIFGGKNNSNHSYIKLKRLNESEMTFLNRTHPDGTTIQTIQEIHIAINVYRTYHDMCNKSAVEMMLTISLDCIPCPKPKTGQKINTRTWLFT